MYWQSSSVAIILVVVQKSWLLIFLCIHIFRETDEDTDKTFITQVNMDFKAVEALQSVIVNLGQAPQSAVKVQEAHV